MSDIGWFDSASLITTLYFLILKAGTMTMAAALAGRFIPAPHPFQVKTPISGSIAALLVVALDLWINSALGYATTLLRMNTQAVYLAISAIGGLAAWQWHRKAVLNSWTVIRDGINRQPWHHHLLYAVTFIFLLKPIMPGLGPVFETDSIDNAGAIMGWLQNTRGPYDLYTHYVSTWEAAYVPLFTITGVNHLQWTIGLEANFLLLLAAYALARILGTPRLTASVTALAVMMFFMHWLRQPIGISTLKPETAFTAAGLMAATGIVMLRVYGFTGLGFILFSLGGAFLMTKYHGTILFTVLTVIYAAFAFPSLKTKRIIDIAKVIWPGAILLALPLQHYLYNIVVHGNIYFPIEMRIGPWTLPGDMKPDMFRNTSLWFARHEDKAWMTVLKGPGELLWTYAGALWIPCLAMPFVYAISYATTKLVHGARRLTGHVPPVLPWTHGLFFGLSLFAAFGIVLFIFSPFSASAFADENDLLYLNELYSTRYILPVLALMEIFIIALLSTYGPWGRRAALALAIYHLIVRIDIALNLTGYERDLGPLVDTLRIAAYTILAFGFACKRWKGLSYGIAATGLGMVLFASPLADSVRHIRFNEYLAAEKRLANLPPHTVFMIRNEGNDPVFSHRFHYYQVRGARFQHTLATGTLDQLKNTLKRNGAIWQSIVYGMLVPATQAQRDEFEALLTSHGYVLTSDLSTKSIVYERAVDTAHFPVAPERTVDICADFTCGDTRYKDWGWNGWEAKIPPASRAFILSDGDHPVQLYWRADGTIYRYAPPPGTRLSGVQWKRDGDRCAGFYTFIRDAQGDWRPATAPPCAE